MLLETQIARYRLSNENICIVTTLQMRIEVLRHAHTYMCLRLSCSCYARRRPVTTYDASLSSITAITIASPATTHAIRINQLQKPTAIPSKTPRTFSQSTTPPTSAPLGQHGLTHALRHAFLRTRLLFRPSTAHCIGRS